MRNSSIYTFMNKHLCLCYDKALWSMCSWSTSNLIYTHYMNLIYPLVKPEETLLFPADFNKQLPPYS